MRMIFGPHRSDPIEPLVPLSMADSCVYKDCVMPFQYGPRFVLEFGWIIVEDAQSIPASGYAYIFYYVVPPRLNSMEHFLEKQLLAPDCMWSVVNHNIHRFWHESKITCNILCS